MAAGRQAPESIGKYGSPRRARSTVQALHRGPMPKSPKALELVARGAARNSEATHQMEADTGGALLQPTEEDHRILHQEIGTSRDRRRPRLEVGAAEDTEQVPEAPESARLEPSSWIVPGYERLVDPGPDPRPKSAAKAKLVPRLVPTTGLWSPR